MRSVLNRLPLRWKLTLAFGAALALVLAAVGVFLHLRLAAQLDLTLERDLRQRHEQVGGLLGRSGLSPQPGTQAQSDETFAHILRPDGSVVAATAYRDVQLLSAAQLATAGQHELLIDRPSDAVIDEPLRLLAGPVHPQGQDLIVVVGASLDDRNDALASFWGMELLGLGAALATCCALGYIVAGLALRPVEQLRRQAAGITGGKLISAGPDPLPTPDVDDELGRLARTLNAMLGRIQQAQESERQVLVRERRFLADASHQLRTPLSIIRAEIELALEEPDDTAKQRAALISTGQETDRLAVLADQLLTLAAGDERRLAAQREPVNIRELLTAAAQEYRARANQSGRRIHIEAASTLWLNANRFRLEQLLRCLLDNAFLHGEGDIALSARSTHSGLQLVIQDSGPGFPADLVDSAFERFRRGGRASGAGLGLSIVQAIAEAHGGQARLAAEHRGCVVVDLPNAALNSSAGVDRAHMG